MRVPHLVAALAFLAPLNLYAGDAPPVLQDLGNVRPTPVPTEKSYDKKRLITSLTVQNSPEGETIITFEASDVGRLPDGKFKQIASQRYSLTEVKPKNQQLRSEVIVELRRLEEAILRYVDAVGGPRDRSQVKSGSERPQ